jgi:peroxiredoxin Q/BCP
MKPVRKGDMAPDFSAVTHTGEKITLSQYRGRSAVVLYFYPKDNTPICSKQACHFRDAYEEFQRAGAVVIGVSAVGCARPANGFFFSPSFS